MRPILEIRTNQPMNQDQCEMIAKHLAPLAQDYEVLVLDGGMTAHVHEAETIKLLTEIRDSLSKPVVIKVGDLYQAMRRKTPTTLEAIKDKLTPSEVKASDPDWCEKCDKEMCATNTPRSTQ